MPVQKQLERNSLICFTMGYCNKMISHSETICRQTKKQVYERPDDFSFEKKILLFSTGARRMNKLQMIDLFQGELCNKEHYIHSYLVGFQKKTRPLSETATKPRQATTYERSQELNEYHSTTIAVPQRKFTSTQKNSNKNRLTSVVFCIQFNNKLNFPYS